MTTDHIIAVTLFCDLKRQIQPDFKVSELFALLTLLLTHLLGSYKYLTQILISDHNDLERFLNSALSLSHF